MKSPCLKHTASYVVQKYVSIFLILVQESKQKRRFINSISFVRDLFVAGKSFEFYIKLCLGAHRTTKKETLFPTTFFCILHKFLLIACQTFPTWFIDKKPKFA